MSRVYSGTVLLPGDTEGGLAASLDVGDEQVQLFAGDEELGAWSRSDCRAEPAGKGSFHLVFEGEQVLFTPSSPSAFAEEMEIPLSPEPQANAEDTPKKYDYDAAVDESVANVKPLRSEQDDDDMLTKPMLVGIVGASTMVIVGLLVATFAL